MLMSRFIRFNVELPEGGYQRISSASGEAATAMGVSQTMRKGMLKAYKNNQLLQDYYHLYSTITINHQLWMVERCWKPINHGMILPSTGAVDFFSSAVSWAKVLRSHVRRRKSNRWMVGRVLESFMGIKHWNVHWRSGEATLVGGLEHFLFVHILGINIPID